jgi:Activator of mitotic machinery Cdc14 phosphatase activation C-term
MLLLQSPQRSRELDRLYKSRPAAPATTPVPSANHLTRSATSPRFDQHDQKQRPLSFVPGPHGEVLNTNNPNYFAEAQTTRFRNPFEDRSSSANARYAPVQSLDSHADAYYGQNHTESRNGSGVSPMSSVSGPAAEQASTQSYPLNDIDYESDPMAVAQELSNLQAIRRMSMDVNNAMDPDLPSFNTNYGTVPALAPSHSSDEEDPSRLFWVPARLHPELAPKEFKTFIQEKVKTIKRSSLSEQPLMSEPGSLRRRPSMLSRQIDNSNGYEDGSTRLRRKESQGTQRSTLNLHDLEELVSDPTGHARRMSRDRTSFESGHDMGNGGMPVLPGKPGAQLLKRSTRTTYRKQGSLRQSGGRRQLTRTDENGDGNRNSSGAPQLPDNHELQDLADFADVHFGLTRVNTDPIPSSKYSNNVENFSRPGRRGTGPQQFPPPSRSATFDESFEYSPQQVQPLQSTRDDSLQSRYANGRPNQFSQPIPQIVETPPEAHTQTFDSIHISSQDRLPEQQIPIRSQAPTRPPPPQPQQPPTRQPLGAPQPAPQAAPPVTPQIPQRTGSAGGNNQRTGNATVDDHASHPNIFPQNGHRPDPASVTPSYTEEPPAVVSTPPSGPKKLDKKSKSKDDGSKKPSWNWFGGSNNEDKDRDKKEEKETKKAKAKLQKGGDKQQPYDNARLDVIQSSIDSTSSSQARPSIVLERPNVPGEEDSKKRPTTSDSKTEKTEKKTDGFLSSLFGSSRRKSDRDDKPSKSKNSSGFRGLSPDPPRGSKSMQPDVDYNWTRFSILEERAIYRMAHMKLANPRRELLSQVLLSNFMYSYLAKVQQMHPQMQIPTSAAAAAQKQKQQQAQQEKQKKEEEERRQQQQQQQQQILQQQREQREREQREQQQREQQQREEEYAAYQRYVAQAQEVRV